MRRVRSIAVGFALALTILPPVAHAQEESRAVGLFEQAARAYAEGRFEDAARLLDEAYAIDPSPVLLYNLARARERAGQNDRAVEAYRAFVAQSPGSPEAARATERIEALAATAASAATSTLSTSTLSTSTSSTSTSSTSVPPLARAPDPTPQGSPPVAAYTLIAAGAAALVLGAVFSALAWSEYQAGQDTDVHARRVEHQSSADSRATVANVSFAAGAALAITGTLVLAFD